VTEPIRTEITDWREVAVSLYFQNHGNRCLVCSKPVSREDARLWNMSDTGDEVFLTHRGCE
jgi:hypothetical protein